MFIATAWLLFSSSVGAVDDRCRSYGAMAIATHRNYKYAAPLALKPLKRRVMNYAQASFNCKLGALGISDRSSVTA